MSTRFLKSYSLLLLVLQSTAFAGLPIEWSGTLGFDTVRINRARKTSNSTTTYNEDSYIYDGTSETAKFQSYVFRLEPKIIVNDAATIKGEISIGNNRGGQLGDNGTTNSSNSRNGFFHYARPASSSSLAANQIYVELFSESAIYRIGRFTRGWGLGALFDDGSDIWDRFTTTQDGIEVNYRFGNLSLIPSWSKISSENFNPRAEVKEVGLSLGYDNKNSGMSGGVYYGARSVGGANTYYTSYTPDSYTSTNYTITSTGAAQLKVIDVFLQKKWEKFKLGVEAPFISGEIENPYGLSTLPSSPVDYKASAYILEAEYQKNAAWKFGVNAGVVSGSNGSSTEFGAMALNPNYQIAHLMFRYNLNAIDNVLGNSTTTSSITQSDNIFESSITNATFAKAYVEYSTEKWTWKAAFIMAKANEVAQAGQNYYNHEKGHLSTSSTGITQDDDMGSELDLGFDYKWNPNILVGGFFGYHFVGDYYGYNNTETVTPKDSYVVGLNLGLQF